MRGRPARGASVLLVLATIGTAVWWQTPDASRADPAAEPAAVGDAAGDRERAAEQASAVANPAAGVVCPAPAVGPAEVVLDNKTRQDHNLGGWPEGAIGVLPQPDGSYTFHNVNAFGGTPERHQANLITKGTLENPLTDGVQSSKVVAGAPATYEWAGGGPLYRDPETGTVLQVLHLERLVGDQFYSELHLGRLNPETGETTYLGPIARPTIDFETYKSDFAPEGYNLDMGMSSLTVIDGYLHLYFPDVHVGAAGNWSAVSMTTARAPVDEVVRAARQGKVVEWQKYHDGGWDSPALGGMSTDLLPDSNWMWHPHVVRKKGGGVLMTAGNSSTTMVMATSPDGVHEWSKPQPLFRDPDRYNQYSTVLGVGNDPTVVGDRFYVYYTQFLDPKKPDLFNMRLMRREVRCTGNTESSVEPLVRYYNDDGHHRVTTGAVETRGSYPEPGGLWGVYDGRRPGTRALFGCREGQRGYFLSTERSCEGEKNAIVRTEGWIHTSPPDKPSTPLYRCRSGAGYFASISKDCEGATNEGLLGYALATSRTLLSRFYDGREHWATSGRVNATYARERETWYVERERKDGTVPLYGCVSENASGDDHFLSLQSDCDGATKLRVEGYIHAERSAEATDALYRCHWPAPNERFVTTEKDCEGVPGGVNEQLVGYVSTSW